MKSLPERIMGYADTKPEATPIQAGDLLHLGAQAAVSRALSCLARSASPAGECRVPHGQAPARAAVVPVQHAHSGRHGRDGLGYRMPDDGSAPSS